MAKQQQAKLTARQYQAQLFEKAKQGNVIACIDTGSGKTLVAAMLLEHVHTSLETPTTSRSPKLSLFLVNLVPLAHQQAAFIDANTSLKIGVLYGEMTRESLFLKQWEKTRNVSVQLADAAFGSL